MFSKVRVGPKELRVAGRSADPGHQKQPSVFIFISSFSSYPLPATAKHFDAIWALTVKCQSVLVGVANRGHTNRNNSQILALSLVYGQLIEHGANVPLVAECW